MMDSGRPAPGRAFWRCGTCGTPNPARPYLTHCFACDAVRPARPDPASTRPRPVTPDPRRPARARVRRGLGWTTYVYAALILLYLASIRWIGDEWWGVVLLLFFPRWLFLAPIALLGAASLWARGPSLWVAQAATAVVIAGPLMGLSLPVHRLWGPEITGERVRILTYNRGEVGIDSRLLVKMIDRQHVDLICFQEGRPDDPVLDAYFSQGWYRDRTKRLASRFPIVEELPTIPERWDSGGRYSALLALARVRAPSGTEFLLASVHMPTLRPGINNFLGRDVEGLRQHIGWWRQELDRLVVHVRGTRGEPVLAAGDFNMPPESSTMASLRSVFRFAFEEAGWGYGYTRPSRSPWFRIDHILASPEWTVSRCRVGPDYGSDHLPLWAEVILPAKPSDRPTDR